MFKRLIYALAGLETGVTGALAMLTWLGLGSLWTRHSIWWVPNLVAAAFYGAGSVRNDVGFYTAVGAAMTLVLYGAVGVVFVQFFGLRGGGFRVWCFGVIVSLTVYSCVLRWFWNGPNTLGHIYAPDGQILLGHVLFGLFLAGYPPVLRGLRRLTDVNEGYRRPTF